MIEVNSWVFWGVCAMAAVGVLQAMLGLFINEEKKDWRTPGAAPDGFRWVLVRNEEP